jgi:hypothetical protein
LDESARLVGGHRWWEGRLFGVLGGWVATTSDPTAKLMLDRHSQHHAWRSGQWWDRLPVVADVDREALVRPPSPGAARALEALAVLDDPVARLAGAYRFALPRLVGRYQAHRQSASPVSDDSAIRTLDLLVPDAVGDWLHGEVLLQECLTDRAGAERAAMTVAHLESVLLDGVEPPS